MHFPVEWIGQALLYQAEQPGYEDDRLPLSSNEIMNAWSCATPLPYTFVAL
jgi:hypothetical protein